MTVEKSEAVPLDVAANRRAQKWTRKELLARACWELAHPLFAWSPRPLWGWRRCLLRLFGAKIRRGVHIYPTVRIKIPWNLTVGSQSAIGDRVIVYALGPVSLGDRVTISQGAHLCAGTHDWRLPGMPLLKLPIAVGDDAWICADAFIGPGVTVGQGAIVGARAVAMKDVAAGTTVVGNPARPLERRTR